MTPLLLWIVACGGQANADPSGEGRGGSAGSDAGSPSGGTSGAAMGGAACDFADDRGFSIGVFVTNQTRETIHLGASMVTCGVTPIFEVEDSNGRVLTPLGSCRAPCESLLRDGVGGCPGICLFPQAITLLPGERTVVTWDGLFREELRIPSRCVPADHFAAGVGCDRAAQIAAGEFVFRARAGTELDCSSTTGIGACAACVPSGDGGCVTPAALVAGTPREAATAVALDARYGVGDVLGETVPVHVVFAD